MKIIDLLNKIANGEDAPKEFKYNNHIFGKTKPFFYENKAGEIFEEWIVLEDLNKKIEILDEPKEDKIEKLDLILDEQFTNDELQAYIYETQVKINEIIDKLNGDKE